VKLTAPDDSSTNPTVTLPTESGELALKSDIGEGGGDYTPEKMVWEDKVTERTWDTEYKNESDVPLYVKISRYSVAPEDYYRFRIDGKDFGLVGTGPIDSSGTSKDYNVNLFIVPAGSTYKVAFSTNALTHPEANKGIRAWHEARMPVAVGTGGSASGDSAKIKALEARLDSLEKKLKK
jgi:hypothetical protein